MVATALTNAARRFGWEPFSYGHEWLDITDGGAVRRLMFDVRPETVLHTAALTRVNHCQDHPGEAMRVNRDGTANVVAAAAELGASVVYFSTDYVFDGRRSQPWLESDTPAPLNVYGASKLAGESVVRAYARGQIVRTSGVFGPRNGSVPARNFFSAIAAKIRAGASAIPVVTDQLTAVTYAPHLAEMLLPLLNGGLAPLTHITSDGSCSWFDWAQLAAGELGASPAIIQPVTSDSNGDATPRPNYSVLGTELAPVAAQIAAFPAQLGIQAYYALDVC